jgi:hypothetical protein
MKEFKVTEREYKDIMFAFQGYVFNRKDETGYYVRLGKSQVKFLEEGTNANINLVEVRD